MAILTKLRAEIGFKNFVIITVFSLKTHAKPKYAHLSLLSYFEVY